MPSFQSAILNFSTSNNLHYVNPLDLVLLIYYNMLNKDLLSNLSKLVKSSLIGPTQ